MKLGPKTDHPLVGNEVGAKFDRGLKTTFGPDYQKQLTVETGIASVNPEMKKEWCI